MKVPFMFQTLRGSILKKRHEKNQSEFAVPIA